MRMLAGDTTAAPWISTPGYLEDRARRAHAALMNLNDTIDNLRNGSRLATNSGRYGSWKRTINNFGAWYGSTGPTTWLWSGTDSTLDAWEATIREWQSWVRRTFPDAGADLTEAPPKHHAPYSPGEPPAWLWGVGVLALGFGVVSLLRR